MQNHKKDIKSMYIEELESDFVANGFEKYRAKQCLEWLKKGIAVDDMTNIPADLRKFIKNNYIINTLAIEKKLKSCYDDTVKYLFKLNDSSFVEAVVMKYVYGYSMCISTQVGCRMNCSFCATGKQGFKRDLLPSEMLMQIEVAQKDLNIRVSHLVLMGMGEPLDNYDNVSRFLKIVSSPYSICIGMRHISLSTCGIVDRIYDLAKLKLQLTLSISLHATSNETRNSIMPINKKYNLERLIKACKYYIKETNRRISFEYAMISGVNDSIKDAEKLARLLKGMLCHVNLIPVNEVKGNEYKKSSVAQIKAFTNELKRHNINATVRRTLGADISASCGQLRQKAKEEARKN